jgi:hypothetical protein
VLNDIPMVIGNDSCKGITDTFFNTLTGTSATTDFFTSGHNNLLHDVLDFNGLTSAVAAIRTQKDIDGRIVGIEPTVFMVPAALEFTARQLLNSAQLFRDQTTIFDRRGISCRESIFSWRLSHDSMPTRKTIGLSGMSPFMGPCWLLFWVVVPGQ